MSLVIAEIGSNACYGRKLNAILQYTPFIMCCRSLKMPRVNELNPPANYNKHASCGFIDRVWSGLMAFESFCRLG